jgi:hypothetical protein
MFYSVSNTRLQVWCPPVWCSGSYVCLAIYCLEHPHSKAQPTTDYLRDLMEQLHETDHYACQYLKVVTGWRPAMTAQPTQLDSRKYTRSGCADRTEGICLSCSHPGKALERKSPRSIMQSTKSSIIPGWRQWWFTWPDWLHIWGLLETTSL